MRGRREYYGKVKINLSLLSAIREDLKCFIQERRVIFCFVCAFYFIVIIIIIIIITYHHIIIIIIIISDLRVRTGKRTCLPRSFIKGNYYFPDVIMA